MGRAQGGTRQEWSWEVEARARSREAFAAVWCQSETIQEVAEHFRITVHAAYERARKIRRTWRDLPVLRRFSDSAPVGSRHTKPIVRCLSCGTHVEVWEGQEIEVSTLVWADRIMEHAESEHRGGGYYECECLETRGPMECTAHVQRHRCVDPTPLEEWAYVE